MSFPHAEPDARLRELARHVTVELGRQVRARSGLVFGYLAVGSLASQRLVESLGMRAVGRGAWLTFRLER